MTLLFPLFLLPAVLSLAAFFWLRSRHGDDWARILSRPVLATLRGSSNLGRGLDPAPLAMAIVFAALASPALRADSRDAYALTNGVVVAVDVSKSMGLEDIRPTRMAAARAAALQISATAGARASALVAYAGDAYLLEPFANDRRQFDAYAAALDLGLVPSEGSDLKRALALIVSIVDQAEIGHARIVVVSDGGGFDSETAQIARRLAQRGHRLDVVLTADPNTQTPVPVSLSAIGQTAEAGGGVLVGVDTSGVADIGALGLDSRTFGNGETRQLTLSSTDWRNLSHWLLLLALPVLLLLFREART